MFVLVTYDIADNKRRNRVAKFLLDYGVRVQESVFECDISIECFATVKRRLAKLIDTRVDCVRYYKLCANCIASVETAGVSIPVYAVESSVVL